MISFQEMNWPDTVEFNDMLTGANDLRTDYASRTSALFLSRLACLGLNKYYGVQVFGNEAAVVVEATPESATDAAALAERLGNEMKAQSTPSLVFGASAEAAAIPAFVWPLLVPLVEYAAKELWERLKKRFG